MPSLPLRLRATVGPDGGRARSLLVFCSKDRSTLSPDACARCGFRCPPEAPPPKPTALLYGPTAAAAQVPAGAASARIVVCLQESTPAGLAARAVAAGRWLAYPVVDARGVLVGTVPAPALALAAARSPEDALPVGELALPSLGVRESDPLVDAIAALTSHHLRQVPIVDAGGRVTGVLSDLALLRWVARGAPPRWR